jgi:isopenicillin N synthase-like dioxygenase
MTYARARKVDSDIIPVIDITGLRDGTDSATVARQLHAASQGLGFIYIRGHGIPDPVIEDAREAAFAFFRTPDADKAAVKVKTHHRGWIGRGGAKMQDDAKADLKESFIWGYEDAAGVIPDDHALRGPNQWPGAPAGLRDSAMAYFHQAHRVAHHLMRGFAIGLGLDRQFFLKTAARPISRASFVYYPAQPEELGEEQFGVGPHTDFGVLTVLCQDSVGGLQVQTADGDWIEAPPIPGTLIVNVGDLLARWTEDSYRSTPHRVVNSSGRERMSLVLAFDPDPDTVVDARDVFGPDHPAREAPITVGDYLIWRFGKAFAYRAD